MGQGAGPEPADPSDDLEALSEIAEIASCPENTVKTRLCHARRLLREVLDEKLIG